MSFILLFTPQMQHNIRLPQGQSRESELSLVSHMGDWEPNTWGITFITQGTCYQEARIGSRGSTWT